MNTVKDLGKYVEYQLNDEEGYDATNLEVYHAVNINNNIEILVPCEFNIGGYVWINKESSQVYYNEYGEVDDPPEEIKENYKLVYCIN